jgi:hypothetical protein
VSVCLVCAICWMNIHRKAIPKVVFVCNEFVCLFVWGYVYARNQGPLSFTRYVQTRVTWIHAPSRRTRYRRGRTLFIIYYLLQLEWW